MTIIAERRNRSIRYKLKLEGRQITLCSVHHRLICAWPRAKAIDQAWEKLVDLPMDARVEAVNMLEKLLPHDE